MKTIQDYRREKLEGMLLEWETRLRHQYKYSEEEFVTWSDVRELYYSIRNEYLVVDLMDEQD